MSKHGGLREFQSHLATRLAGASGKAAAGLLGVQAGPDYWLLNLSDSGEVVPLTPITGVPLTHPWFAGIANIRGNLHAISDFAAFQGQDPTPRNAGAQLLLIGARHGSNAALLVSRTLGLRNIDDLTAEAVDPADPPWADEAYSDREGRRWKKLNVKKLLADERFMAIGLE